MISNTNSLSCLAFSEGFVCASLDFWRQSPSPCVLDHSTLCCPLHIWRCQWQLLYCWQVKLSLISTYLKSYV